MASPRGGAWVWVLIIAAGVIYVIHGLSFGLCLQDDAYICLRFARNLADGHGIVYNPGERVEGYTNFLWTVASSALFLTGTDPPAMLRILGLLSGILALLAAALLARALAPQRPWAAGAAALFSASLPFFVAESVMGLETALFAALSVAGLAAFIMECRQARRPPLSGALLALAALTRPEGILVAAVIGSADLLGALRRRSFAAVFFIRWVLFAVPVLAHLVFRIAYYHDIVPNTFHAKVGGGIDAFARGWGHAGEFAYRALPLLFLAALGAWAVLARDRSDHGGRLHRRAGSSGRATPIVSVPTFLAVVIPALFAVYVIYVGGDFKATFRFFATPVLFMAALGGVGTEHVADLGRKFRAPPLASRLIVLIVFISLLFALGGPVREFTSWRARVLPFHIDAGRWAGHVFPAGTWLATGNAGVIPYESGLPTIDMYGLCDRHIAARKMPEMGKGRPGHEKGDGAYVLDRMPQVILIVQARFSEQRMNLERAEQLLMSISERELWADPRFHRDYRFRSVQLRPGFHFNYFERVADR